MKKFVVVDETGNISTDTDGNPEAFETRRKAAARAVRLAGCTPGEAIRMYQLCAEFTAPIGDVVEHPVKDAG